MTFDELLAQIPELLQREQRLSYRALKVRFQLDDDYLEALKEELIYAKRLEVDDHGRVLVWTDAADTAAAPDTRPPAEAERQLHTLILAVLALLQREKRVTYRTLRYVFGVDEACLHAVRDELRFRQLAREEGGQGLVWTGEDAPQAVSAPRPAPAPAMAQSVVAPRPPLPPLEVPQPLPEPLPVLDDVVSHPPEDVPVLTPVVAHSGPEAERRQLTVLFCDLVGSTQLSGQLDPEDLRAVVRSYQAAAAGVIQRYEGHIAQYLGDGLLVYFGYPVAHEDDARRAVHTGLGIVQAITTLNTRLAAQYSVQLAVRLGIHTGPVVVGVMGGGGRHEHLALGETPNVAARLQNLAPANAVVISAVTARLVQGVFALEELGTHTLHGVAEPMLVSRVRGLLATPSHDEEFVTATVPVLVGREEESGLLRRRWEQSKAGLGQVVFVSGEAGIGKSALVEALRAQVREALIAQRAGGKPLPAEGVQHIVAKTDGVPLYVEELTKMLLASPLLREEADRYVLTGPLHTVAIPDTLQDALMARLDQLQTAKEVAQLGAVLGREFAYELLQAIAPQDEETLQAGLAQLVAAELLYQRGRPPRATTLRHARCVSRWARHQS